MFSQNVIMLIFKRDADGSRIFPYQFKSPMLAWPFAWWTILNTQQPLKYMIAKPYKQKVASWGGSGSDFFCPKSQPNQEYAFECSLHFFPSFSLSLLLPQLHLWKQQEMASTGLTEDNRPSSLWARMLRRQFLPDYPSTTPLANYIVWLLNVKSHS